MKEKILAVLLTALVLLCPGCGGKEAEAGGADSGDGAAQGAPIVSADRPSESQKGSEEAADQKSSEPDFSGIYTDKQNTTEVYSQLDLVRQADGTYTFSMGLYRLAHLEGTAVYRDGVLHFASVEPAVEGDIAIDSGRAEAIITASEHIYISAGDIFPFPDGAPGPGSELENLTGEYHYTSDYGIGKLMIEKTSYGYDISDYESESAHRFLADSSSIESIENNRIYIKYPEQVFSDGTVTFSYYILEYSTDEIKVYYGKSAIFEEAQFLYRATKNNGGQEPVTPPEPEELPTPNKQGEMLSAYYGILRDLYYNHAFPDGEVSGYWAEYEPYANQFAIFDLDGDGEDELLVYCTSTYMAGMTERIYDFDPASGEVRESLSLFPLATFYDNGIIKEEWSHNQGRAGDALWPYTLWQYDPDSDGYTAIAMVDAWDRKLGEEYEGNSFPADADRDGDGVVYYLMEYGTYALDSPIDGPQYEQWWESLAGGAQVLEIPFRDLSEENIQ